MEITNKKGNKKQNKHNFILVKNDICWIFILNIQACQSIFPKTRTNLTVSWKDCLEVLETCNKIR